MRVDDVGNAVGKDEAAGGDRFGLKGYRHYAEDYVREDGEWRIGRLELSRLRVDPLGEDPLVPSEGGPP